AGSARLRVTVAGRPVPPCVTLNDAEIELDGRSGWLPLPLPPLPLHWRIDIQLPRDLTLFPSANGPEVEGVGLIALRSPLKRSVARPGAGVERGSTGVARAGWPLLRLASLLMWRTISVWEVEIGARHYAYVRLFAADRAA